MVLAILGVPVLGMLIAVAVIYYKQPDNMVVVFGVILFIGVQYIMLMFFFLKRVESMVKKEEQREVTPIARPAMVSDKEMKSDECQLPPEEERVFPVEEDTQ